MKRLVLTTLVATLLVPGLALAYTFDIVPSADCDGWSVDAQVAYGQHDREPVTTYTVTLTNDDTGETVAEFSDSVPLEFISSTLVTYTYAAAWPELCGNYTATGSFVLSGIELLKEETFSISFTCACDEPEGCFLTPGYWKTHPDDPTWPDDGFSIGGVHHSNDELIAIMDMPVQGDPTIILANHLVAAKLNVMAGTDGEPVYNDAIAQADELLAMHPLGSMPRDKDIKSELIGVKDILAHYNEIGCDESEMELRTATSKSLPSSESTTWGDLKSRFR